MASYMDSPEEGRGRRDLSVAVAFLVLSVVLLYMPADSQSRLAGGLRATVLRPFVVMQVGVAEARLRAQDAMRLQGRLDSLAGVVVSQGALAEENAVLRELLGIQERTPGTFVAASVIRPRTVGAESTFIVDAGSDDGVQPGDPVVMGDGSVGLVGVIQQVRPGMSVGMDWSHPDFRASAMSADGRVFGFVEPVRGELRELDRLLLNGVPYYELLDTGVLITTSGLGDVYPRGIPIGRVLELEEEEGEWRKAYWLKPVVETGDVTHVLVVVGLSRGDEMLKAFQEPAPGPADTASAPGGGEGPP